MINCLLIKLSHSSRGVLSRSYRTLTSEEITVGRGAECGIHLLDPRLSMHHAVIKRMDDGKIHLVAINGELAVDGAVQKNIELSHGTLVSIGPYQIKVEPAPPDVDIAISLMLLQRLPDDFQDLKLRTHEPLRGAASFKRRMALWMAAFIALVFIGLPLAQNLIPSLNQTMAQYPLGFDRVWSPGHVSNAHLHFGSQCFNCHEKLTEQVNDQACVKCHQNTAPHITDPALQKRVFHSSGRLADGMRCAECHREHKAPHPLAKQDNNNCVKCHADIKAVDAKSALSNVKDFDRSHPEFKLSFIREHAEQPGTTHIERIPQSESARLAEQSGLKFPHSQHVGLVQGPNGVMDIRELNCSDCHRGVGKEMRIQAVEFKRDCQSCHANQLQLGLGDKTFSVPHGDEEAVMNALIAKAPKDKARYATSLKENGCAYCHEIAPEKKDDSVPWRVKKVTINQDWFSKAQFNHASHRTQKCVACHQVEQSESSHDVAMPDRKNCLRCHSGNSPKPKRIASSCMSCHSFHNAHTASPQK